MVVIFGCKMELCTNLTFLSLIHTSLPVVSVYGFVLENTEGWHSSQHVSRCSLFDSPVRWTLIVIVRFVSRRRMSGHWEEGLLGTWLFKFYALYVLNGWGEPSETECRWGTTIPAKSPQKLNGLPGLGWHSVVHRGKPGKPGWYKRKREKNKGHKSKSSRGSKDWRTNREERKI